ncbi:MAG: hypothetical protein KBA28_05295 [Syntrophaceae bacterium]|jgi:hypothetical protein|nr:hypothetical protein [Syntrophaceae bacterium]
MAVNEGSVGELAQTTTTIVQERMAYVTSLAENSKMAVDSSIAQLMNTINGLNMQEPPVTDSTVLPNIPGAAFETIEIPDIPALDFGDTPKPVYEDVVIPDMPTLPTVYEVDPMTLYDELSIPESELVIEDLTYVTTLSDVIESKLQALIDAGSSGLPATVEQAIYDRAVARKTIENVAMNTEAENYFAARGFSIPPGAMSGRLLEIQEQASNALTDLNNDILRMQGELAYKGTWEAYARILDWEKQKREFFAMEVNNVLAKAKVKAENLLTRVKLMLDARESRLKNEQMLADDVLKRYQMIYDYLKTVLIRLQANVDVYKTKSEIYISSIEVELKKWEGEVKKITTTIAAKSDYNKTQALIAELGVKKAELSTKAYIEKYKSMNEKYSKLIEATVDAMKTVGGLYSQVASGALSAIHAGVSLSSSGSAGMSYSNSKSESTSVSHDTKEVI